MTRPTSRAASDSTLLMQYEVLAQHGIVVTQPVGFGGQAQVYRAFRQASGIAGQRAVTMPVAVKVIKKHNQDLSNLDKKSQQQHLQRELAILRNIDHDRCLKFYDCFEDEDHYFIITEYLHGLDLFEQATRRVFFEDEILNIAYQVLQALDYMHSKGMAHRDIKLENIMFTEKIKASSACIALNMKLIDFGLAYYEEFDKCDFKAVDAPGTSKYKAPEVIFNQTYDPRKVDLWSVGVLMYILICGEYPFLSMEDASTKRESYDQPAWNSITRGTRKLVRALLEKNPNKRITAAQAMNKIELILRGEGTAASDLFYGAKPATETKSNMFVMKLTKALKI